LLAVTLTNAGAALTDEGAVAIVGAKAHTMSDAGVIDDAIIIVRDGKIAAVGTGIEIPPGSRIFDAHQRLVTPGLITSATQLGLVEVSSSYDTVDHSESAGSLGASFDIQYALNPNSTLIPIARADGITHGIVMPTGSGQQPFAGLAARINVGQGSDLLEQPAIAVVAAINGAGNGEHGNSRSADWIELRRALTGAAEKLEEGESSPGDRDEGSPASDDEALFPVLRGDIPLVIRTQRESDIRQAVAVKIHFGIRLVLLDAHEAWRAADLLAEHQVPVILEGTDNLPTRFDYVGSRLDNAAILNAAGVSIGFYAPGLHTSHNAGLELRQTAGLAVANGLDWEAALAAVTSEAARIWGMENHVGRIEPGMHADLVVWSGDPFETTTCALHVFVDGKEASLENRQKLLRDRYLPAGQVNKLKASPCATR
jgi:imidazolonepropionase-like amidohydrolase